MADLVHNGNGAVPTLPQAIEAALANGDISKLSIENRIAYYNERCRRAGLDALARPFEFIYLNNKLTLYALKGATDQLAGIHSLSSTILSREMVGDLYEVLARVSFPTGRSCENLGAVPIAGLKGDNLANAKMKCITKAIRRATLALCGLGMLDETELETCKDVRAVAPDGSPGEARGKPALPAPADKPGDYATQAQIDAYVKGLNALLANRNAAWVTRWADPRTGEVPKGVAKEVCNSWRADNHLVKWAVETGRLDPAIKPDGRRIGYYMALLYHQEEGKKAMKAELRRYHDELAQAEEERLRSKRPELFAGDAQEDDQVDDWDLDEGEAA
jgi:hypothetical protein